MDPEKLILAKYGGVGGPWKTLEYKLGYLIEDIADQAGTLIKADGDEEFLDMLTGKIVLQKHSSRNCKTSLALYLHRLLKLLDKNSRTLQNN